MPFAATRAALLCAVLLIALQVAAKAARDALFCVEFSAAELPRVMTAAAVLSGVVALLAAAAIKRLGPGRVIPALLFANAGAFLLEYLAFAAAPRPTALLLYLHTAAVGGVVVSGFWSIACERFNPHELRNAMSRIGLGTTVGGLLGGLMASRVAVHFQARSTLLAVSVLSIAAAFALRSFARPSAPGSSSSPSVPVERQDSSRYLWELSAFVALTALSSSLIDFTFKVRAMERFANAEELVHFFAIFYMLVSVVAFVIQALITPLLLERTGLGVALGVLPVTLFMSGLAALLLPGLAPQAVLRGSDGALRSSLHRSAYEPLYTPLAPAKKRSAKALIDVVADKFGDMGGSLASWILIGLLPAIAVLSATGLASIIALLTLLLVVRLHRGYVAELADSLRQGKFALRPADIGDRTTRLTLSRTAVELDRQRLLTEIEALHARGALGPSRPPPGEAHPPPSPQATATQGSALSQAVAALVSDDPTRIEPVLHHRPVDARLVAFVVPLLENDDVAADSMSALASFGETISGQLADALQNAEQTSSKLRRRILRVLAKAGGARSREALVGALLGDPDFEVRRQAAQALDERALQGEPLQLDRASVFARAVEELAGQTRAPAAQRLELAFLLLALVLDREAILLSYRALLSADQKLRGTALEYLENVVPPGVQRELFAEIELRPAVQPRREAGELLEELRRTLR